MKIKLNINIEKKYFYILLGVVIVLAGVGIVFAALKPNPGHSGNEVYIGDEKPLSSYLTISSINSLTLKPTTTNWVDIGQPSITGANLHINKVGSIGGELIVDNKLTINGKAIKMCPESCPFAVLPCIPYNPSGLTTRDQCYGASIVGFDTCYCNSIPIS